MVCRAVSLFRVGGPMGRSTPPTNVDHCFRGLTYHRTHATQVKTCVRNDTRSCVCALIVRAKLLGPIFGTPLGLLSGPSSPYRAPAPQGASPWVPSCGLSLRVPAWSLRVSREVGHYATAYAVVQAMWCNTLALNRRDDDTMQPICVRTYTVITVLALTRDSESWHPFLP